MQKPKINILLFHDRKDWPPAYVDYLNNLGFSAKLFRKPSDCLKRVQQGLGKIDVILVHKDLGDSIPEEWSLGIKSNDIVRAIHDEAEHVRVGIVSGEYPDGTRHVLGMGADFYVNSLEVGSDWVLEQYRKGVILPKEQEMRGIRVEMEDFYSRGER